MVEFEETNTADHQPSISQIQQISSILGIKIMKLHKLNYVVV